MNKTIKIIISILIGMWLTALFYSFLYFFITRQILYFLIFFTPTLVVFIGSGVYEILKLKDSDINE